MVARGGASTAQAAGPERKNTHADATSGKVDGGGRSHLGKNKEAFDAELCALYQAAKTFEGREEEEQQYTIFTDSTAAIARVRSNDAGSRQSVAIVAIESCER